MPAPTDGDALLARAESALPASRDDALSALAAWAALDVRDPASLGRAAGLALRLKAGELALSIARRFVDAAPGSPGSRHALALALRESGRIGEALAAIDAALALAPHAPVLASERGVILLQLERPREAAAAFERCLAAQPEHRDARVGRGLARLRALDAPAALPDLEWWVAHAPDDPDAWRAYGEACEMAGRFDDTIAARNREVALRPGERRRARDAGLAFARIGLNDRARELLEPTVVADPDDLVARWVHWQSLPLVYRDAADAARWRERWIAGLDAFERIDPAAHPRDALAAALLASTPFFMHYQGGDLGALQRRFGALATRWARAIHPAVRARAAPRREGRLRVGFATAYFHAHTVHGLFHRWLARLDRSRFEVAAIYLGSVRDAHARALPSIADEVIEGLREPDEWVARIGAADLDALVWLDIGMHGLVQTLSPLRFAPVTAMAWGHPVTAALDAVGHFLTGEAMEPPGADAHYAERLVRLPGLGIRFEWPLASRDPVRRPLDGTRAPRLVCAQTVYKLHPGNLDLVARVAARLPDAEVHFVPHPSADVRSQFEAVARARFAVHGARWDGRAHVHPGLKHDAFLALLAHADVFLDMPGWSGGHTTLEALATDLPVVTLPGAFMRQRHTFGMLTLMGLDAELAVADEASYVEKAAQLAEDRAYHTRIVAAIRERKWTLYEDDAPVRALERWLLQACAAFPLPCSAGEG